MTIVSAVSEPLDEHLLVQRLLDRDEQALRVLYTRYSRNLSTVILRLVKDSTLAQDILQESLLKIWISIASYEPERGRFYTWMARICCNHAIDVLRTRQHRFHSRTASLERESIYQTPAIATFHPEHIGLREMTKQLPPPQHQVIDLLYFDGFTQAQVAERLNIPIATVKSRARAGLQRLARMAD